MKLLEALRIINAPADASRATRRYALVCGFTPLALETFFHAHLRERVSMHNVMVSSGRFGDVVGNIGRALDDSPDGIAAIVEWADIDPRLGLRGHAALATAEAASDLVISVTAQLDRLARRIESAAASTQVVVCRPTLPLPPFFLDPPSTVGVLRARCEALVAGWVACLAGVPRVRIIDTDALIGKIGTAERRDAAEELRTGFPYTRAHADAVADVLAAALVPPAPKKGLITDLDDTLWRGLLGEVGVDGVQWGLEHGAHVHTLYQQMLGNLAESGVLLAVASKNDAALVISALERADLVISARRLFPVRASWGRKSDAVRAVLDTWNVGADSVVFVDDSPLELAEVRAAYPDVECLEFTPNSPASVITLLERLAELFGRVGVTEEDRLRADSIRNATEVRDALSAGASVDADAFLVGLRAELDVSISHAGSDDRAFELVNKTNQFNLNGRRYSAGEWHTAMSRDGAFLLTVAYRDKFGPLGKIAVAVGIARARDVQLDAWVLSCRAFARRIEFATLRSIFELFDVDAVTLDIERTPRNGPVAEFVNALGFVMPERGGVRITRTEFDAVAPELPHVVRASTADSRGA